MKIISSNFYMINALQFFYQERNPVLVALLLIWSFFWKGQALWRAAKRNDLYWFIPLLVINTIGILEILYLYVFSKEEKKT